MEKTHALKHVPLWDKVLVKAIQTGAEVRDAAWDYIWHHWLDYFVGTIKRLDGNESDAREMLGEVFEPVERALCKNLFRYEAPLQSYVNRAVKYRWYKHLREKNLLSGAHRVEMVALESEFGELFEPIFSLPPAHPPDSTPAHDPFAGECLELALKALESDKPKQHSVWVAFKVNGLKQHTIANLHGFANHQTVKNYVQGANKFLRAWFESNPDCMN